MKHPLHIQPEYFNAVLSGIKPFEIRKNDRGFQKGDQVRLTEYLGDHIDEEHAYTGRHLTADITYVTNYEQKASYVVFGLANIELEVPKQQ